MANPNLCHPGTRGLCVRRGSPKCRHPARRTRGTSSRWACWRCVVEELMYMKGKHTQCGSIQLLRKPSCDNDNRLEAEEQSSMILLDDHVRRPRCRNARVCMILDRGRCHQGHGGNAARMLRLTLVSNLGLPPVKARVDWPEFHSTARQTRPHRRHRAQTFHPSSPRQAAATLRRAETERGHVLLVDCARRED